MSWTQEFEQARGGAARLSDIRDFDRLVQLADRVGKDLCDDKVSSRQVRSLLSETTVGASRIRSGRTLGGGTPDEAAAKEAALLNITLVYAAGREKNGTASIRKLVDLIGTVTGHVKTLEDFKVLRKFSEAIVAYYKFHGGK